MTLSGGIKVTTLAVLLLAIIAEARDTRAVTIANRTIPDRALRVATMTVSDAPLDRILFEVISAFATCGLFVGLSAELPDFGNYVLADERAGARACS